MEDMSELIKQFSEIANSNNIPDNIKNALNNLGKQSSKEDSVSNSNTNQINSEAIGNLLSAFNSSNNENKSGTNNIDFETILKMKSIIEKMNSKDDPRSKLLMSLKPYLRDSRKGKLDQYVQLFNMSKAFDVFNFSGGDKS